MDVLPNSRQDSELSGVDNQLIIDTNVGCNANEHTIIEG